MTCRNPFTKLNLSEKKKSVANKMRATFLSFRGVCEEELDKVLNDKWIYIKTIRLFALDFYA